MLSLSSTKILPFFFPLGFCTPTGVIMFKVGRPSSLSVYVRACFFDVFAFDEPVFECEPGLVCTCLDEGRFADFDFEVEGPAVADLRAFGLFFDAEGGLGAISMFSFALGRLRGC